ncbi:MAG: guanylate kinase [Armatimonadota bacterium]|nr:guanylate kinase [bacterium]MDW8321949.1 guanylate kinase [Armatimonadota bacterium]
MAKLFVLSGPSGVGKDTLLQLLLQRVPGVVKCLTATTRPPREGEQHGADYLFLSEEEFTRWIAEDRFLEYARYNQAYYGTPRHLTEESLAKGLDVILKIEVQGGLQVRQRVPEAVLIFIQPPSMEVLRQRLTARATDTPEQIEHRLRIAEQEMRMIPHYDYLVTNDDLEQAVDLLRCIILAERARIAKR